MSKMLFDLFAWPYRNFLLLEEGGDLNQTENSGCQSDTLKVEQNQCIGKIDEVEKAVTDSAEKLGEKEASYEESMLEEISSERSFISNGQSSMLQEEMCNAHHELDLKQNQVETLAHQLKSLKAEHSQCIDKMQQMAKQLDEKQTLCSELQAEKLALNEALEEQELSFDSQVVELRDAVTISSGACQSLDEQVIFANKTIADAEHYVDELSSRLTVVLNRYNFARKLYKQAAMQLTVKTAEHGNLEMECTDKLLEKDLKLEELQGQLNQKEIEHNNEIRLLKEQKESAENELQQLKALIEEETSGQYIYHLQQESFQALVRNCFDDVPEDAGESSGRMLKQLWHNKGPNIANLNQNGLVVECFENAIKIDSKNTGCCTFLDLTYLRLGSNQKTKSSER